MTGWQSLLVAATAIVFVAFIVWKYRPLGLLEAIPALGDDVKRARERARLATSPEDRAAALMDAGDHAARDPRHTTAAIGYYLRAMRLVPASTEPVLRLRRLLERRKPSVLESILWRKLAHTDWSGDTADVARCAAEGLVALYRGKLRDREKAAAMAKLAGRL